MRIAIFGGSFDPPHRDHVAIIEHLEQHFDLCIVMPCYLSPFKRTTTQPSHRLAMLQCCTNSPIDTFELSRTGPSYAVHTLRYLRDKYPDDQLFWVIGSDCLNRLSQWYEYQQILQMASFYVIGRAGTQPELPDTQHFVLGSHRGGDLSSTAARVAAAFGRVGDIVTPSVARYIQSSGLYDDYTYITSRYAEFGLGAGRIAHTYRATITGITLAHAHAVDVQSVIVALLLHDIAKELSTTYLTERGVDPAPVLALPPKCRHAIIGRIVAQREFGITDQGILDSIEYHTTARPGMSPIEQIVYLADAVEPERQGMQTVRQTALVDLDAAMHLALVASLQSIRERKLSDVSQLTTAALEYYTPK